MDLVRGQVDRFRQEYGLDTLRDDEIFEAFAAYCVVSQFVEDSFHPDQLRTGQGGDLGIDARAILLNHDLKTESADVKEVMAENYGIDAQAGGLVSGSSKLVILSSDQQIVDQRPGLHKTMLFLRKLTPEQVAQLEAGEARIALVRKGGRIQYPLDVAEVAAAVRQLSSAEQIVKYLDSDTRLTGAKLKSLGHELNVEVPAKLRAKGDIQFHLAQVLAGHQSRSGNSGYAAD